MDIDERLAAVHPYGFAVALSLVFILAHRIHRWTTTANNRQPNNSFPCATPFPFNQSFLAEIIYTLVMSKVHGDLPAYVRYTRNRIGHVFFRAPSPIGGYPSLTLTHPDDQAALVRKENYLQWKVSIPVDTVTAIHGERNFQNIPSGPDHSALRKVYSSILSPKSLEGFTTIILDHFHALWDNLEHNIDNNEMVEILPAIKEAQLKLMCKILYGFNDETEKDKELLKEFSRDFHHTEKALFALGGKTSKAFKVGLEAKHRISKILNERFDSIFEERLAIYYDQRDGNDEKHNNNNNNNNNSNTKESYTVGSAMHQIIDALIRSGCKGKDDGDDKLSYNDAKDNLYLLLEASHGTTMYITASLMYLLNHSDNRESLQRMREEVKCLKPTYESIKSFSFGEACVNETMRIAPIIGVVGYLIPEGKSFEIRKKTMTGPMVVTFDSFNWYEDPNVFENPSQFTPERWLVGHEKEASKFAKSTFRPFGSGRHICLGFPLAKLVMNANLYCFASKENRSIAFDEAKVKLVNGIFPNKQVSDGFVGKVVCEL